MKSKFVYIYSILSFFVIASFIFVVVYSDSTNKPVVLINGSTLLNKYFDNKIPGGENSKSLLKNFIINTQEQSTTDTLKSLFDNEASIGVLDRQLTQHEITMLNQNDFKVIDYAKVPYVAIVNKKNNLDNITTTQLKNIINNVKTNWNEIDPKKESGNPKFVIPNNNLEYLRDFWSKSLSDDQNNVNYRLDRSTLKKLNLKTVESKMNSFEKIINEVENSEDAIALVPYTLVYGNSKVNVIKLDNHKFNPNNLTDESYPFSFKLSLCYRENKETSKRIQAKSVIDIINTIEFKGQVFAPGKDNFIEPVN